MHKIIITKILNQQIKYILEIVEDLAGIFELDAFVVY